MLNRIRGNSVRRFCAFNIFSQKAGFAENAAESAQYAEADQTEEERLYRIRNISGLKPSDYKKHHGVPDVTPYDHHQRTLRWHRRQVGLYGTNCGVDPALCFTTKEEMESLTEYEKVAFDKTIKQVREEALQKEAHEKEERRLREKRVAENLKKVEAWKEEIRNRMAKKEVEVSEAKQKRERLLEEVRRHFGYTIDFRDEKFQIMLELKEQEMRKQAKLEKKKKKDEMFMKHLASLETGSSKKRSSESEKPGSKTEKSGAKETDPKTDPE